MLCKCRWIVLYTVHFTAFCLGGPFFPGHGVYHHWNIPFADEVEVRQDDVVQHSDADESMAAEVGRQQSDDVSTNSKPRSPPSATCSSSWIWSSLYTQNIHSQWIVWLPTKCT